MITQNSTIQGLPSPRDVPAKDPKLMEIANQLESSFVAEMLKSAGVGEARSAFGGGAGEDQFASFLVQEYADAAVKAGGLGLSEAIYESLLRGQAK